MKLENFLLTLVLLTTLISVSGCGKKGASPRNLSVSTSFAISSAFSGGIHFSGKNDKGEWFSVNATDDDSVSVVLGDGIWDFVAVGWAGDMTGKTSCAVQRVQLTQATTDINLSLSEANCSHSTFSGPFSGKIFADSTNGFFPLHVFSCGTFFNGSSQVGPQTNFSTLDTACTLNADVPADMKRQAKAIEVAIAGNITPGVMSPHIVSGCIPLTFVAGSDVGASALRIPTNHIPVMIKLFEDSNCQEKSIPFEFPAGLGSSEGTLGHQARLHKSDSPNKVVLMAPFTMSRNGLSLFYKPGFDFLPEVKCGSDFCLPAFSVNGTAPDFVASRRGSNRIDLSSLGINNCQASNAGGTDYTVKGSTNNGCYISNGNVIAEVQFNDSIVCTTSNCDDAVFNSENISVRQVNPAAPEAYEVLYRILGGLSSAQPNFLKNSLDYFRHSHGDDESPYGIIRYTREMMSPDGPLGMFWEGSCASMSSQKSIQFEEDGIPMEMQVNLTYSGESVPANLRQGISATNLQFFDKKIVFRERVGSAPFVTKQIMHFDCNYKVGMSEGRWSGTENYNGNLRRRNESELVFWNTHDSQNALIEVYRHEKQNHINSLGQVGALLSERTNYDYLVKLSNDNKYRVISQNYEWNKDSPSAPQVREHLNRSDISTGTAIGASGDRIVHNKLSYHLERPSDFNIGLLTDIKPKHMGFDQSNLSLGVPSDTHSNPWWCKKSCVNSDLA